MKTAFLYPAFFPPVRVGPGLSCGGIDPNANDNMGGDNPPKVNPFEPARVLGDKVDFKRDRAAWS